MGLFPNPFLSRMEKSVEATLARISEAGSPSARNRYPAQYEYKISSRPVALPQQIKISNNE